MGSEIVKAWGASGRDDMLRIDPERLVLIEDPAHPLYDERVKLPLVEEDIRNVMSLGILEPVIVRKNGERKNGTPIVEVVDGRQRVRWAREANKRLRAAGSPTILVPVVRRRGDDGDMAGVMVSANEIRREDDPVTRAKKAQRLLDLGKTEAEVAMHFGKSVSTIKGWLSLLDAAPAVQSAVSSGKLSIQDVKRLTAMPREEQAQAMAKLAEPSAKGETKREKREKVTVGRGKVRPRTIKTTAQIRAAVEALGASKADVATAAVAMLRWALGEGDDVLAAWPALRKAVAS